MEIGLNIHRARSAGSMYHHAFEKMPPLMPRHLLSLCIIGPRPMPTLQRWLRANTTVPPWTPKRWHHTLLGYQMALLFDGVAASLALLSARRLPLFALQGSLMVLGIILVAHIWGKGPGLFATLVGSALLECIVLPSSFPRLLPDGSDALSMALFLLVGFSISLTAGQRGRANHQAREKSLSLREAHLGAERERLRLRTLLDVLPAAVGMMDAEARILETNPANLALWGENAPRPGERAQVQRWRGWWPDTGKPLAPEEWAITRALSRGETTINQEVEVETSSGQRKVILDSAAPISDEQGIIIGGVGIHQDISERKRMEEALRVSEREAAARASELEAVFEAMTDALFVYDAEGRILRHNTAARQIFALDVQPDIVSLPFGARAPRYVPLDKNGQPFPVEQLAVSRILRGEVLTSSHASDERLHTLDGRELSVSITGRPLYNPEGAITGAVAIIRDVTERRRLEQEVAERAAQLETIFESIADGVIVTDCQGRVQYMNQAIRGLLGIEQDPKGLTMPQLEALAGFSARNAQGQPLSEAERPINRYCQGETLTRRQSVDLILQTRDEREIRVNNNGAPIRGTAGQIIGAVEVIRDVTEQRRLEHHTRETLNALVAMAEALVQTPDQASEALPDAAPRADQVARRLAELTRSVLGSRFVSIATVEPKTERLTPITVVGLLPKDEQQWWANWNPSLHLSERLLPGAYAALCMGDPVLLEGTQLSLPIWQCVTPERKSLMVPMRVGETLVGILRVEGWEGQEEYACPNRQVLIRAVARLGALVLERERLLREREEARASELALRETNAHMDTFLGMAGHELKTPLTSIKLALQLAERRILHLVPDKIDGANDLVPFLRPVAQAERQADRLDRLVSDLLDVSRIRAGKLDLHLDRVDLAAIVREVVEEQRQANPERLIVVQFPDDLHAPITIDADRIGQVVTNYLTNALKYSPAKSLVAVGIVLDSQQARVWVRDEGPGLPAQEQERIWERFHRADGVKVLSGTGIGLGLGLHICRTIIGRHQGQVGVESTPGKGSTFWFSLPLDTGTPGSSLSNEQSYPPD
jgi:PAS domain S-box-containing protein